MYREIVKEGYRMHKKKKILMGLLGVAATLVMTGTWGNKASAAGNVGISEKNFPDATFRDYVSANFDLDNNGKLSPAEIEGVVQIDCADKGITSLKGINNFTYLQRLNCSKNVITKLDVSGCTGLQTLQCQENKIKTLNVSANDKLQVLYCFSNPISTLDLSASKDLNTLAAYSCKLQALDLKNNKKLQVLFCYNNPLTELDLSSNKELTRLAVNDCKLQKLNLKKNSKLTEVYCHRNQLTALYFGEHEALKYVNMGENQIPYVNFENCTLMKELVRTATISSVIGNEDGRAYSSNTASVFFDKDTKVCTSEPVKITVRVKDGTNGTVVGGGYYEIGEEITIEAIPTKGNTFKRWWLNSTIQVSEDAKYTFKVQDKSTFTAVFGEIPLTDVFEDVKKGEWYMDSIRFMYERGLMSGRGRKTATSPKEIFSPMGKITRAEFVTVLYNLAGKPAVNSQSHFADVEQGQWYTDAVAWAYEKKITSGVGGNKFGTNVNISRQQMATMLYSFANMNKYDMSVTSNNFSKFADGNQVDSWAQKPLLWATDHKIVNGNTANPPKLNPRGDATRAECAAMVRSMELNCHK